MAGCACARRAGYAGSSCAATGGHDASTDWVIRGDKTVEAKNVTVGQAFEGRSYVERGLQNGDQVVIDGYFRLENGTRIEIIKTEPAPAPATAAKPAPAPS